MLATTVIIDDFLTEIDDLCKVALQLNYIKDTNSHAYPGLRSHKIIKLEGVAERVSQVVKQPLRPVLELGHGIIRCNRGSVEDQKYAYLNSGAWVGMLCLSTHNKMPHGLDLKKHIPTNTEDARLDTENLKRMKVKTVEEGRRVLGNIVENEVDQKDKWQTTMHITAKINRLILFRPWLWHNPIMELKNVNPPSLLDYNIILDSV